MTDLDKYIYIDCDGVLVDLIAGFRHYCIGKGDPIPTDWEPDNYDLATFTQYWPEKGLVYKRLAMFFKTEAWANLPQITRVEHLMPLKGAGWHVYCLTQVGNKSIRPARTAMLDRMFPGIFEEVIFTNMSTSKIELISERHEDNRAYVALIEDKTDTCIEAAESFCIDFIGLITQSHNIRDNHFSIPCGRFGRVSDVVYHLLHYPLVKYHIGGKDG